jgi:hypothetical protein
MLPRVSLGASQLLKPASTTPRSYVRGASGIGMGTTVKHLRRTTSGAAGNSLGATMKYMRRTTSAAANNGMSTTIIPFVVQRLLK